MATFKIALIQMLVGLDKQENLSKAQKMIKEAAENGASLIVLPEYFNSPCGHKYFDKYSEPIPGTTTEKLAIVAKKSSINLIGGSFPEKCSDDGKIYNTCTIYNSDGLLVGKYRKMHMFNIDAPGKMTFRESDSISAGNQPIIFQTDSCKIGVGICYDVRFCELAELYAQSGCEMLIYPCAFGMTTGPAHWEVVARSRAMQSQCFIALCSAARNTASGYVVWGHSLVVDPWGTVIASMDEQEGILYADIDLNLLNHFRTMMPLRNQRRTDVYATVIRVEPEVVQ